MKIRIVDVSLMHSIYKNEVGIDIIIATINIFLNIFLSNPMRNRGFVLI